MEATAQVVQTKKRIESIDFLRGIAMIIMALDHVRDFFHIGAFTGDPLDLNNTTAFLFFTRWITHFCAPAFVFLSGVSIYLQSQHKSKAELSSFLITRGLWLIFVEMVIITLAWTFNPMYEYIFLQVIWAIGVSMVFLGVLIWLPYQAILAIGLVIVLGHNLLDGIESAAGFQTNFWWDVAHKGYFSIYSFAEGHAVIIMYAFVPWIGVMSLGYCAGVFYSSKYTSEQRKKIFIRIGLGLLAFFVVLRFTNLYGDPVPWSYQKNGFLTFLSFIKINKYPPSLLFLSIFLSAVFLILAYSENIKNRLTQIAVIFGRTAFFYYILHLYLIHLLAMISFFVRGHNATTVLEQNPYLPFHYVAPGDGYGLFGTYLAWFIVVVALYPLCKWYNQYKSTHREQWWLSYL